MGFDVPWEDYRGTSPIRSNPSLGTYSRNMPRALWKSWGGGGGAGLRSRPTATPSHAVLLLLYLRLLKYAR